MNLLSLLPGRLGRRHRVAGGHVVPGSHREAGGHRGSTPKTFPQKHGRRSEKEVRSRPGQVLQKPLMSCMRHRCSSHEAFAVPEMHLQN